MMQNLQIIALVAIGISLVSIGLIVANNASFQSTLLDLNSRIVEQSQTIKSLNEQLSSSQQEVKMQANTIQSLTDKIDSIQKNISEQKNNIDQLNGNASLMTDKVKEIQDKVTKLEQDVNQRVTPPPPTSKNTYFVPVALKDENGTLWTSWFVKESLYYPTLYDTSCDARNVDCYVHMDTIPTKNGTGIEADTIGSTVSGYWFLGYSPEYVVPDNGTVTISGNFLKNDTFNPPVLEGRSHIFVFLLDRDPNVILDQKEAVTSSDKDSTWYTRTVTFNLHPGQVFRVGIGAENNWSYDWKVYVAWNSVKITALPAWTPLQ